MKNKLDIAGEITIALALGILVVGFVIGIIEVVKDIKKPKTELRNIGK